MNKTLKSLLQNQQALSDYLLLFAQEHKIDLDNISKKDLKNLISEVKTEQGINPVTFENLITKMK